MNNLTEITHDREFLRHFLSRFRVVRLSPEMIERLKTACETDSYAAYGYARWLSCVNPEKDSLYKAEVLFMRAMQDVPDAMAALAEMHYTGQVASGKANPGLRAFLALETPGVWSELRQVLTLEHTLFGEYGFKRNHALVADILRGQTAKYPDVDTLYSELLAWALWENDPEAAEEAFRTVIERGG